MEMIRRGDVYYADLDPVVGSEQSGVRPALIIQNEVGNRCSPTVIVAAMTSRSEKSRYPTHVLVGNSCLPRETIVLCEQLRTIDKQRLTGYLGHLKDLDMRRVDNALKISLALTEER